MIAYYKGVTTDPGRIPESWSQLPEGVYCRERKKTTGDFRFCTKERLFKPDRSHFCSAIRRNVLRMDHFCPWLGNCVGFHNHKFFLLFLFYATVAINLMLFNMGATLLSFHSSLLFPGGQSFFI